MAVGDLLPLVELANPGSTIESKTIDIEATLRSQICKDPARKVGLDRRLRDTSIGPTDEVLR